MIRPVLNTRCAGNPLMLRRVCAGVLGFLGGLGGEAACATTLGKWSGGSGYLPVAEVATIRKDESGVASGGKVALWVQRTSKQGAGRIAPELPRPLVPAAVLEPGGVFVAVDPDDVKARELASQAVLPGPLVPPNVLNSDLKVVRFRIVED